MLSHTNRIDENDDNIISESEYYDYKTEKKDGSCFCFCNKNNRIGANYEESLENSTLEHSISISAKTLESVQDAIDGKISLSAAKLHRYLTTPNWGPTKKFAPYNIWNFPLPLFNDYGIGTKLYFEFVQKLSFLSLFISIIYIPIYIMLFSQNKLNESSSFEQLSLGNLGDNEEKEAIISIIGISFSYRLCNRYICYTDFFCILLLLLFIIWFESTLKLKEREYDDMTTTVGDFSIEIDNLPLNISSRRYLANFFQEKWGEIMDVSICYNDGEIIKMYQEHSKIVNKFTKSKVLYSKAKKASSRAKETNKLQRLQTKLDKSTMNMIQITSAFNNGERHSVKAYITFENEPERNNCLREYNRRQFKYIFGCKKNTRFIFDDHLLKISQAPEPSNILYLNHGYSKINLFFRRTLTTILSTLIIIASFGLIFSAQFAAKSTKIDTSDCVENNNIIYNVASANNATSSIINCYCFGIGITTAMNDNLCKSYFAAYLQSQGFNLLSSFIIILVNQILSYVIYNLVEKEKHFTVSQHQSALSQKLFISQFMNTALTILIINCNLNSFGINNNIFNGEYDINFQSKWCLYIGNSIIITMIMGCFNPHLTPLLIMKYSEKKRLNAIQNVQTQNELNQIFEGESFTLADRFADISYKIVVILLYTPLLPLLWIILFISCCSTYWFNKIFFLRIAAIPPKYDTKLAQNAVTFIKIGISLHLIMSIWVFGSKYRDPEYLNYSSYISANNKYDNILKTIFNVNSLPFFILFILLNLTNIFSVIFGNYICCSSSSQFQDEAELLPFSQEYVKSENMELYLLCNQPTLKNAFGPDLLPIEDILNRKKIENAEIEYKKELAKEMIDELMNIDIENDDDENNNNRKIKKQNTEFLNVSPEFWNIREVGIWLERLKCGKQYMYQFMFKKVNGQRLLNITDQFLEESIEIKSLNHRNKILKSVRKLRIKAGFDKPPNKNNKKKLTKKERKELEIIELENYNRHLKLTQQYTQFAKEYQHQIEEEEDNNHSI